MPSSEMPSIFMAEASKPKPTSTRHCGFLLATPLLICGSHGRLSRSCISISIMKRWSGCAEGLDANRNYSLAHFHLAATLARLGELSEARAAVQAGLALDPSFTIRRYRDATNA